MAVAGVLAAPLLLAPIAAAAPVGDTNSESPFIDEFFQDITDDGFGYLDPAWKVSDAAWLGCGVLEAPGAAEADAVNAIAGRGYTPGEATSILDSSLRHLCN